MSLEWNRDYATRYRHSRAVRVLDIAAKTLICFAAGYFSVHIAAAIVKHWR